MDGFKAQVSTTTVRGVYASPGATCWFWACYRAGNVNGQVYFVPSQSCVVQSLYTSPFILITPSATSTDQIMPTSQVFYTSTASEMQTSSTSLLTQFYYTSNAPQLQTSLQIQLTPPMTQHSNLLPSPASSVAVSLSPYPSLTVTPLYKESMLFQTTSALVTSCDSWWCSRTGHIAMSITASIVLIVIILTFATICTVTIRQRNISKR